MSCHYHSEIRCIPNPPVIVNNPPGNIQQNIVNLAQCAAQSIANNLGHPCPAFNIINAAGVCWDAVRAVIFIGSQNIGRNVPDIILKQAHASDVIINAGNVNGIGLSAIVKFFRIRNLNTVVPIGAPASHVMLSIGNGLAVGSNNGAIGNLHGEWSIHNIAAFQWNGNVMLVPDNGQILHYLVKST
jgi:hypothetical protein